MRAGGDGQPLRGSETSDGSDVRCQIVSAASPRPFSKAACQGISHNHRMTITVTRSITSYPLAVEAPQA